MAKVNGYFRLQIEDNGVYIKLIPPTEDGEPITMADIMSYLSMVKMPKYDIAALNQVVLALKEPTLMKLTEADFSPVSEKAKVQVAQDRMTATIRLYPPSNHGKLFEKKDMIGELTHAGIKYGVAEAILDALVENPIYCQDIMVAKGKEVQEGTDAKIEYHFETKPLAKPKLNVDGTVDFHQLNIFTKVKKDQLLATLTPEFLGEEGIDVYGKRIYPQKVKKLSLKYGRNIRLSEDKLQMFSEVDGDVKLEKDTVFVSNSFVVAADVDASTGDIVYEGNVVVNGNVRTGFSVQAKGDIEVKGVVEGADLYSGGNIVLTRGIQGMNRGKLEAAGDIITKFIESAKVKAGGTVRSGSILHSVVDAGDTIICEGKKSFVIGGSLSALNEISVMTIGNHMGTVTNVKLGVEASVLENLNDMQKEFEENKGEIEKARQVLVLFKKRMQGGQKIPPDKIQMIREAGDTIKRLELRQEELQLLIKESRDLIEANARGRLRVSETAYPGVRIQIANSTYIVKDNIRFSQFQLDSGEVVIRSY